MDRYLPHQGILPHTDGPAYHPLVITLSLGTHTLLHLEPTQSDPAPLESPGSATPKEFTLLLPPRSLLILSGQIYSDYLHSIKADTKFDSMESLRECVNWEAWWQSGAAGLEGSLIPLSGASVQGGDDEEADVQDEKLLEDIPEEEPAEKATITELPEAASAGSIPCGPVLSKEELVLDKQIREAVSRRRFVEQGSGWERGRRISLTLRRVDKVRKGVLRF